MCLALPIGQFRQKFPQKYKKAFLGHASVAQDTQVTCEYLYEIRTKSAFLNLADFFRATGLDWLG